MSLLDRGEERRLRKLGATFAEGPVTGRRLEKAARDYGRAVRDALGEDPALARRLFGEYDARLPDDVYPLAFPRDHHDALATFAAGRSLDALAVTFEVVTRLGLPSVQRDARNRTAVPAPSTSRPTSAHAASGTSSPPSPRTSSRMRLRVPSGGAGGPLLNEHGEVIGVLTGSSAASGEVAFALTIDTLAPLLTSAGFGLTP